jgi:uncharacterized alpha-E superfamily protein
MLSRTADSLYWLARYMERAENVARLLDVGLRMASLSSDPKTDASEWHSTIAAAGCEETFYAKHKEPTAASVIAHLVRDKENPSSILSCLATVRQNARAVRTALTTDMWEGVNSTWIEARALDERNFSIEQIRPLLEWVKERSQRFGGAVANTMLRSDAYWFVRLGTFVERADNTARILDVKYNVLLPRTEPVGGMLDYYQWTAILRSVSALRAYHWIYRDRLQPWHVAELLILRPEMPRSLVSALGELVRYLDLLGDAYGSRGECHRLAGEMHAQLRYGKIERIFQGGLHEYLTDFIESSRGLGSEIRRQYLT